MLHSGPSILPNGEETSRTTGKTAARAGQPRSASMLGLALMTALGACAHRAAPVAMAPPPPVGHPYQVMVQVPPPVSRRVHVAPEQQREVQQAFNVVALKSALMVAALSCNQEDQYNRFMTAFQPHVLSSQHVMDAYFKRIGGYSGRGKEDEFITLLANNQSVNGISQGSMFCLNNIAEYNAVLALKTDDQLDAFVTDLPPDAPVVAAAQPTVTPLAPGVSTVHVAVVHASHHVHLVRSRPVKSTHSIESRAIAHGTAPASAGSGNAAQPISVADRQ